MFESFPYTELFNHMDRTISSNASSPGLKLQQVIEGWSRYIVPFTSNADISGELPGGLAGLIAMVLHNTTRSGRAETGLSHPAVSMHIKRLEDLWPTIWIWIKKLYARFSRVREQLRDVSGPGRRPFDDPGLTRDRNCYDIVVGSLLFFLGLHSERNVSTNGFIDLVKGTEGVLQMLATCWIDEARDDRAVMGFASSTLHHPSMSHALPDIEQLIVAGCSAGNVEAAKLALVRIRLNLLRLQWQSGFDMREVYQNLLRDCGYVQNAMRHPESPLCNALRADSNFVACFIDVMVYLLEPPHTTPPPQLFGTAAITIEVYMTTASPKAIRQTLEHPFFDVIERVILIHYTPQEKARLQNFNTSCSNIIAKICQSSLYQPILIKIRQNMPSIDRLIEKTAGKLPGQLLDLKSQSEILLRVHGQYKQDGPPVFCCGNKQVCHQFVIINRLTHLMASAD